MFGLRSPTIPIVVTGHVDHGKSTLIGRLLYETGSLPKEKIAEIKKISKSLGKDTELAFLTDQLKEERERNMTIDTTQIFFKTRARNYVIIDAPGHAELIKNMISGASQAQAAVLIIDIAEGVKDQTRRHASIIEMLGIKNVVVACNKMDLVSYDKKTFETVSAEISAFLKSLKIQPLCIIPVSAKDGDNIARRAASMGWYRGPTLIGALDALLPHPRSGRQTFRLPVQDVYKMGGEDIAVGRIASGEVSRGEEIVVHPAGSPVTVDKIKIFERDLVRARKGANIGLILRGAGGIKRGDVLATKGKGPLVSDSFRGRVFWMAEEPLLPGEEVVVRCASQEIPCRVMAIEHAIDSSTLKIVAENAGSLKQHEVGSVVFKAAHPVVTEAFSSVEELGRFTVERGENPQGAGIVTAD